MKLNPRCLSSVTYVSADGVGSCDTKGNYRGVYDIVMSNQSDWSQIMLTEPNCNDLPGVTFGPVVSHFDNAMLSHREPVKKVYETSVDVMHSLAVVDIEVLFLYFCMFVTIWFLLMKFTEKRSLKKAKRATHFGWDLACVTFAQSSPSERQMKKRVLLLSYSLAIFWLVQYIFAYFSTDLVTRIQEPAIDYLVDLAKSRRHTSEFISSYNTWKRFETTSDPIRHQIWAQAIRRRGLEGILYTMTDNRVLYEIMLTIVNDHVVCIASEFVLRFAIDAYCLLYYQDPRIKISKERFLPVVVGTIFRPGLDISVKKSLSRAYARFQAHGWHSYYGKNPLGILKKAPEQLECYAKLLPQMDQEIVRPLRSDNIISLY